MRHPGKKHWLRRFVLDEGERANWRDHVVPKLAACRGREKIIEPRWCTLHEFHVHAHAELVPRLVEFARTYRLAQSQLALEPVDVRPTGSSSTAS